MILDNFIEKTMQSAIKYLYYLLINALRFYFKCKSPCICNYVKINMALNQLDTSWSKSYRHYTSFRGRVSFFSRQMLTPTASIMQAGKLVGASSRHIAPFPPTEGLSRSILCLQPV